MAKCFGLKARAGEAGNDVPHRLSQQLVAIAAEEAEILPGALVEEGKTPVFVAGQVDVAQLVEDLGRPG